MNDRDVNSAKIRSKQTFITGISWKNNLFW